MKEGAQVTSRAQPADVPIQAGDWTGPESTRIIRGFKDLYRTDRTS